jgi:methionine synthase II (cobalamin-independent)
MFENYFPERDPDYKERTFRQFARLAAAVPSEIELGFHLCYGSPGDQPLIRLHDAQVLVELMNGIDAFAGRRVDYIHIPVPRHAGEAFFAPLRAWRQPSGTQLYLGLLQHDDTAGDQTRITAARRVVGSFGVAAECGFGRTDPNRLSSLLASHRAAAQALALGSIL